MAVDPKLLDYCVTPRQREVYKVLMQEKSHRAAARALNINKSNVDKVVAAAKKRAVTKSYAPEYGINRPIPDPLVLSGTTHGVHHEKGEIMTWYKTKTDAAKQLELLKAAINACLEDIPAAKPVAAPTHHVLSDLLNLHVLTDYHLGALAWSQQTRGADWDVEIAADLLVRWWQDAIDRAPDAETGIFCQLGDLIHADNLDAMTPASGHILDADTRHAYVIDTVVLSLRRIMQMMLTKYPKVHVIISDANHDPVGALWMRSFMADLYRDEPRVQVDRSPDTFNSYEHGTVSLGFHHGHKVKPEHVAKVFTERFRELYGRTKHTYLHQGHRHHLDDKDYGSAIVFQHPTMAAKDEYAASRGYESARLARVDTYSAVGGKIGEIWTTPEMLDARDRLRAAA